MIEIIKIGVNRNKHREDGMYYRELKTEFSLICFMIAYFVFMRIVSGRKD